MEDAAIVALYWARDEQALAETAAKFGAYCRKHGILAASVSEWEAWFAKHPNACNADELTNEKNEHRRTKTDLDKATREIARKDKALSETATMLVLAKKAQAVWGDKESCSVPQIAVKPVS